MSKRGECLSPSSVFGFSFSHAITRASKVVGFDVIFELGDDAHFGLFVEDLLSIEFHDMKRNNLTLY